MTLLSNKKGVSRIRTALVRSILTLLFVSYHTFASADVPALTVVIHVLENHTRIMVKEIEDSESEKVKKSSLSEKDIKEAFLFAIDHDLTNLSKVTNAREKLKLLKPNLSQEEIEKNCTNIGIIFTGIGNDFFRYTENMKNVFKKSLSPLPTASASASASLCSANFQ